MSIPTIYIKKGASRPKARVAVSADVTDTLSSVAFVMAPSIGGNPIISGAGAVEAQVGENANYPNHAIISYQWSSANVLAMSPGIYHAEFDVTFSDGNIETYPARGYVRVIVEEDLQGVSDTRSLRIVGEA